LTYARERPSAPTILLSTTDSSSWSIDCSASQARAAGLFAIVNVAETSARSALPRARQREDRRLDLAVVDGVVHADEVERLVAHDRLELRVLPLVRARDADVAHAPLPLQLLQDGELRRDVAEVVHLDQVHRALADALEGRLDLRARGRGVGRAPAGDVDLGRPEDPVREPELARDPPGDLLRGAVARGGVEHRPALLDERAHHVLERADVLAARDLRERGRAAEADDGDALAAGGDGARQQRLRLERCQDARVEPLRAECERGARAEGQAKPFAT
jgi:hypothetical protein